MSPKVLRVSRDTKEYRREARVAREIKTKEYLVSLETVRKVHISQERCVCL